MVNKSYLLVLILIAVATIGWGSVQISQSYQTSEQSITEESLIKERLPARVLDIIESADRVELYLPDREGLSTGEGRQEISAETLKTVRALLLSDDSYAFNRMKRCVFVPHIGLDFVKGDETVTAYVSFSCPRVVYQGLDHHIGIDADPSIAQWMSFALEHYPENPNLRFYAGEEIE